MSIKYSTPEEAEAAFYDAIERSDIDALSEVWSSDDNIVCIHPGCNRIEGRREVLQSFADMFAESPAFMFSIIDTLHTGSDGLAVHLVREEVELDGQLVSIMVSTNIYHYENGGWRMLLHHASHEPDYLYDEEEDEFDDYDDFHEPPPVLH